MHVDCAVILAAMYANSRSIASSQTGIHEQLAARVARQRTSLFQKPITDYNRRAFDDSIAAWQRQGSAPLILDAGCGVGLSSRHLATCFPTHFIIGVDQSADRLARDVHWPRPAPQNMLLVRADLVDYWRLLQAQRIALARHYLLYPNPWPKIGHLGRRWHGHPVFPSIVALGGAFECRSNWRIYVDECAAALTQLTGRMIATEALVAQEPITPFEKKYRDSGQGLWRCVADLSLP
jgi:tRNA (guanine-N7-)-methyltransferase